MQITPFPLSKKAFITQVNKNSVQINDKTYDLPLLVLPNGNAVPWSVVQKNVLSLRDLIDLKKYAVEMILLGTGDTAQPIPFDWTLQLLENHLIIDVSPNKIACGTYHVMISESRPVVLALLGPNNNFTYD